MRPGAQHGRGDDRTGAEPGEQVRTPAADQLEDHSFMGLGFAVECLDASGEIAQHGGAGPGRDVPSMIEPEPSAGANQLNGGLVAEATAELLGAVTTSAWIWR